MTYVRPTFGRCVKGDPDDFWVELSRPRHFLVWQLRGEFLVVKRKTDSWPLREDDSDGFGEKLLDKRASQTKTTSTQNSAAT